VSRVYYRFVLAMRRTDLILYCGILNLILDIVLDLVLMRFMGVAGLALPLLSGRSYLRLFCSARAGC